MTAETSSYTTTIGGYVALAAITAAVYYSTQSNKKRAAPQASKVPRAAEPRKDKKTAKKQRVEQFAQGSAAQGAASHKRDSSKSYAKAAALPKETANDDDDADELNNREFAKQLSSLKEGKKFVASSENKTKKQKSVKQSRAKAHDDFPSAEKVSAPSSTAGIDADDDRSPAASPEVRPVDDATGVSDMLEASSPGPSSLRIVPSEFEEVKRSKKQQKAPEPALTKKQRQNRKKAEAAKAAGQEAEQERKKQMEAQRRLARISEGRAAKDGSQSAAAINGGSAWKGGKPNGLSSQPAAAAIPAPLDTFDSGAASAPKTDSWVAAVPSEEKQMELLKSETEADEWSTVTSTKAKKGKKPSKATPTASEKAEESSSDNAFVKPTKTAKAPQAQKPKATPNGKPAVTKSYGSYSALSTDEPEVEQEWDV